MGWSYGWNSRQELVDHILRNTKINGYEIIQHFSTCFGKHLWVAVKLNAESFIVLYLLKKDKVDWGYKGISEEMGPIYLDCPAELLDKTVGIIGSAYSDEWRNKIGQLKCKKKVKYKEGDFVEVFGMLVKIIGKIKRSYKIQVISPHERKDVKVGDVYKVTAKNMSLPTNSIDYILNE
jgi:hypothetical protein